MLKASFIVVYQHYEYCKSKAPVYQTLLNDEYAEMIGISPSFSTFVGKVSIITMGMSSAYVDGIFEGFTPGEKFGNTNKRKIKAACTKFLVNFQKKKQKCQIYSDFKVIWPSIDKEIQKVISKAS
jgi:hypothetical protein